MSSCKTKLKDKDIIGKGQCILELLIPTTSIRFLSPDIIWIWLLIHLPITLKHGKKSLDYLKKAKIKAVIDSDLIKNIILDRFKANIINCRRM